jgi:hypothetical protein
MGRFFFFEHTVLAENAKSLRSFGPDGHFAAAFWTGSNDIGFAG